MSAVPRTTPYSLVRPSWVASQMAEKRGVKATESTTSTPRSFWEFPVSREIAGVRVKWRVGRKRSLTDSALRVAVAWVKNQPRRSGSRRGSLE